MADHEADALRRHGYTAVECSGPNYWSCPILAGRECPAIEDADVLVYDAFSASSDSERLIEQIREIHPGVPLVVVDQGMPVNWIETEGEHGVTPLIGAPTGERLAQAVEDALAHSVSQ
jgi:DNA-binding NtrC family response regulator